MTTRILLPILSLLLALTLGYVAGRIVTVAMFSHAPVVEQKDTRPLIPVLTFEGFENGELRVKVVGNIRIEAAGIPIRTVSGGLRLPLGYLPQIKTVVVPTGMHFVASKNGKKYYPVESPSAQNLSVQNRIYFPDALAAEAAGYTK